MVRVRGVPVHPLTLADRKLLARSVEIGRRGWGRVHPNPMVGAVVARDGQVLAEGWHEEFGGPHAEVVALEKAGDARGTTLYTSLEPCAHQGKTPPCAEAVCAAGVSRVVYWAADPGRESGGGGDWLRRRGVQVDGPFGEPGEWVAENPVFFHSASARAAKSGAAKSGAAKSSAANASTTDSGATKPERPYVAIKLAASLDGGIAPPGGRRVWLTGDYAQREVHRLRAGFGAVMIGTGTWKADDPRLTARGAVVPRVPPLRVLLDRRGELPTDARALEGCPDAPLLVVTAPGAAARLQERLCDRAEVVEVPSTCSGLDLAAVLQALAVRGVDSVFCEGGGRLAASLLSAGLADRLYYFVAPLLLGPDAVPAFPLNGSAGAAVSDTGASDGAAVSDAAVSDAAVPDPASVLDGWQARHPPVRYGADTLIVLDRGS